MIFKLNERSNKWNLVYAAKKQLAGTLKMTYVVPIRLFKLWLYVKNFVLGTVFFSVNEWYYFC